MSSQELGQEDWTQQVIQQLTRHLQLYHQLLKMAQSQGPMLKEGQSDELLRLLSNRQRLIDEIQRHQDLFEPLKQGWDERIAQASDAQRLEIKDLKTEIESVLDAILKQDDQDRQHMEVKKTEISDELQRINKGGAAHRAYGKAVQSQARPQMRNNAGAAGAYGIKPKAVMPPTPPVPPKTDGPSTGAGRLTDQQG